MTPTEIAEREADEAAAISEAIQTSRASARLSRMDFAIKSFVAGWLTEQEAEDWASGVSIPTIASDVINALPLEMQLRMRISVRTQAEIGRTDNLILALMQSMDVDDDEMDAVFGINQASVVPEP